MTAVIMSAVPIQVDQTLELSADGSDVVEIVIAKISKIFDSDHRLLRRIAYVETNDGAGGVPPGGIWAVDESKLNIVLTTANLMELREEVNQEFKINLSRVTFDFLRKPLVSGLVARLYLHYLEITKNTTIPLAVAIGDQAQFWHRYYYNGTRLTVHDFKQKVRELEGQFGTCQRFFQ